MSDLWPGLQPSTEQDLSRDRAINAFLTLGEKLRSFYSRTADRNKKKTDVSDHLGVSTLFNTIEGEIIPRLMLAHHAEPVLKDPAKTRPTLTERDHEIFFQSVTTDTADHSNALFHEFLRRGISEETLFLDLLSGAARRLGVLWEEDRADFTEVTIGLCRLHEILRLNTPMRSGGSEGPSILLATACADQHVFGVVIVAEFFRRAGWRVRAEPGATSAQLAEIIGKEPFDVFGLSAACGHDPGVISSDISLLRAASLNKSVKVLVGGRLFVDSPALVSAVGADATAIDAKSAPAVGQELLAAADLHC